VTAGYICPEPRRQFYAHLDAANVDLKGFTEDFYHHVCGGKLGAVLDTLEYLHQETSVWFELTTLLIPNLNDSDAELDAMTGWVVEHLGRDVPMHFTAFHPDFKMLDRPATPPTTLQRARARALANGVRHAYTGNVHDTAGQSTYCPGCGQPVVVRNWYLLGDYRLTDQGQCRNCGTLLPGVYDGPPGAWGPHRQPVEFHRVAQRPQPR
jgi:pyruvate formate lyase activating enzyme